MERKSKGITLREADSIEHHPTSDIKAIPHIPRLPALPHLILDHPNFSNIYIPSSKTHTNLQLPITTTISHPPLFDFQYYTALISNYINKHKPPIPIPTPYSPQYTTYYNNQY